MKRVIDIVGSAVGLVVLFPVMLLTAVGVRLRLGKPVLFRQRRPGLGEKSFELLKFRTMRLETAVSGRELTEEERMTPWGLLLRRTSLDELPQLWNVLKGDMSLVGPRPLLERYLPFYTERERRRHAVRPGITGWAQVHGRNDLDWDERLDLDVWYADHRSLLVDLRIMVLTLKVLLRLQGVREDPSTWLVALDARRGGR
jgi:sugar transferase EpsL